MDKTGYYSVRLPDEDLARFYEDLPVETIDCLPKYENYYYIFRNSNNEVVDKFCWKNGTFEQVKYTKIGDKMTGVYSPKNLEQELAFDMLKDKRTTVKLITGRFGSGKTMALVVAALEALNRGLFEKIIWVRNNVQVKDTDQLGALPGTELDKSLPYLMPMADHCGGIEGIKYLIDQGKLEVIPLAFLRGRSIRNSIIISSEAENMTKEHLQLLLGRVDAGSNLWIDADLKQRDRAVFEKSAGIERMIDKLSGEELFGYVHLQKSERSPTARLADKMDD